MGCDIHIYPEKLVDGKWVVAEQFTPSDWWYEAIADEDEEWPDDIDYDKIVEKYTKLSTEEAIAQYGNDPRFIWSCTWNSDYNLSGRNYNWFSILADVRNGYGFAGVDTGSGFKPIDDPRGLPNDISPQVQKESDRWDCDGHSHSWVTLRELLDYDWDNQYSTIRGVVGVEEFKKFLIDGKPSSWCGSSWGEKIVYITNDEMKHICMGNYGSFSRDNIYMTQVTWQESYREAVGETYLQTILDKLSEYGDPDEVRIVFWFDN